MTTTRLAHAVTLLEEAKEVISGEDPTFTGLARASSKIEEALNLLVGGNPTRPEDN